MTGTAAALPGEHRFYVVARRAPVDAARLRAFMRAGAQAARGDGVNLLRHPPDSALRHHSYNLPMDERALASLPGGDLVLQGLRDLRAGIESSEALLVQVGATNLRLRGLDVPAAQGADPPEHRLYARLRQQHGLAAHSCLNALVRRLVSLERALPCVRR